LNYFPIILQTTGIIVFTFGLIIWNRKSLLSRNLALLAFALALWSITDSFLYVSPSLKYKIYWAAIGYPGSQFSPVLLFFFSLILLVWKNYSLEKE
jgi:hypothetical protein